jgi:hypothetical protein
MQLPVDTKRRRGNFKLGNCVEKLENEARWYTGGESIMRSFSENCIQKYYLVYNEQVCKNIADVCKKEKTTFENLNALISFITEKYSGFIANTL